MERLNLSLLQLVLRQQELIEGIFVLQAVVDLALGKRHNIKAGQRLNQFRIQLHSSNKTALTPLVGLLRSGYNGCKKQRKRATDWGLSRLGLPVPKIGSIDGMFY